MLYHDLQYHHLNLSCQTSHIWAVWDPGEAISQKNPQLRNTACVICTSTVAIILDLLFQLVSFSAKRDQSCLKQL